MKNSYLLIFLPFIHLIKIFTFHPGKDNSISYAAIKYPTHLPPVFTLCSSFKETYINGNSFFTIYGEDGKSWLTLSNWATNKKITIWLRVISTWKKVSAMETYWMNFWIHVCIYVDSKSGILSISMNGEQTILFKTPELQDQAPNSLQNKLIIGVSDSKFKGSTGKKQFDGKVANLKIFSEKTPEDIRAMSSNLCKQVGDIIDSHTIWRIFGSVKEEDEENWRICNKNNTYRVAIPAKMNWNEAMKVCTKLGTGNLTDGKNFQDIRYTISLFNKVNSECENVWTPLIDVGNEGIYYNAITRQASKFLPWELNQPDGADEANYIALRLLSGGYHDTYDYHQHCASCDLHLSTEFSLLGVCKDTYFGKLFICLSFNSLDNFFNILWEIIDMSYYPTTLITLQEIYVHFPPDSSYLLSNTDDTISYRGMQSSIR